MTSDQEALLNAIEAAPDEWSGKMIYADWLDENGHPEEAAFIRAFDPLSPSVAMDEKRFWDSVIAQKDDEDYQESGWLAAVFVSGGVEIAALASYSHCSCYGTWESLSDYAGSGGRIKFDWIGSVPALLDMAARMADPSLPARTVSESDYNARHLDSVYLQVLEWSKTREAAPSCGKPKQHRRGFCDCCAVKVGN